MSVDVPPNKLIQTIQTHASDFHFNAEGWSQSDLFRLAESGIFGDCRCGRRTRSYLGETCRPEVVCSESLETPDRCHLSPKGAFNRVMMRLTWLQLRELLHLPPDLQIFHTEVDPRSETIQISMSSPDATRLTVPGMMPYLHSWEELVGRAYANPLQTDGHP